jgi:hypothetical protein
MRRYPTKTDPTETDESGIAKNSKRRRGVIKPVGLLHDLRDSRFTANRPGVIFSLCVSRGPLSFGA